MVARIVSFVVGIALLGLGIAVSIRAGLGTSPISALPAVLSHATPLSVGVHTILMNLTFVAAQVALLRRRFPPVQFVQILVSIAFGVFTDLAMAATAGIEPGSYAAQWFWTLVGIVLVGTGVFFQVRPRLTTTPGEGIVKVIAEVTGHEYGHTKIAFDSGIVLLSIALSFLLMGRLEGVREGTLAAAVLVGSVVTAWGALLRRLERRRDERG